MIKLKKLIIIVAVVIILGGASLWLHLYIFSHRPAGGDHSQKLIEIAANEPFNVIAQRLKQAGIISGVRRFALLARIKGDDKRLRAGEYALSTAMSPLAVLEVMVNGEVYLRRLMIPEGYTIRQIAAELGKTGIADPVHFEELAFDNVMVASFGLEGDSLEGYLYPDTYFFPKGTTANTVIAQMVKRFQQQFSMAWQQRLLELDMTLHQVVTLASIIEKETGDAKERPIIASVFHHRLKRKMRLESDPTVIYGIKDFNGNLSRNDLRTPTPYNTYVIGGLPPGPIANPGHASLEAALFPAQTRFLYFVSKNDTTHHFSATLQEHRTAVRKYQQSKSSKK